MRTFSYVVAILAISACASHERTRPAPVFVGSRVPADWPTPQRRQNEAAPAIEAMRFSSLVVPLGSDWSGDVVTTTNATSVEIFTSLYEFDIPKIAPGRFRFAVHMLDLPAFLVRPYALHVIARNASGARDDTVVPFEIAGRP